MREKKHGQSAASSSYMSGQRAFQWLLTLIRQSLFGDRSESFQGISKGICSIYMEDQRALQPFQTLKRSLFYLYEDLFYFCEGSGSPPALPNPSTRMCATSMKGQKALQPFQIHEYEFVLLILRVRELSSPSNPFHRNLFYPGLPNRSEEFVVLISRVRVLPSPFQPRESYLLYLYERSESSPTLPILQSEFYPTRTRGQRALQPFQTLKTNLLYLNEGSESALI